MRPTQVRVRIRGRVQGVGFRWHVRHNADDLSLRGWVRNLPDGSVEALFAGEAAAVDRMVAWCRHGPPAARVTDVEVDMADDAPPPEGFRVLL